MSIVIGDTPEADRFVDLLAQFTAELDAANDHPTRKRSKRAKPAATVVAEKPVKPSRAGGVQAARGRRNHRRFETENQDG